MLSFYVTDLTLVFLILLLHAVYLVDSEVSFPIHVIFCFPRLLNCLNLSYVFLCLFFNDRDF